MPPQLPFAGNLADVVLGYDTIGGYVVSSQEHTAPVLTDDIAYVARTSVWFMFISATATVRRTMLLLVSLHLAKCL